LIIMPKKSIKHAEEGAAEELPWVANEDLGPAAETAANP
jgi:hypothetical protein